MSFFPKAIYSYIPTKNLKKIVVSKIVRNSWPSLQVEVSLRLFPSYFSAHLPRGQAYYWHLHMVLMTLMMFMLQGYLDLLSEICNPERQMNWLAFFYSGVSGIVYRVGELLQQQLLLLGPHCDHPIRKVRGHCQRHNAGVMWPLV